MAWMEESVSERRLSIGRRSGCGRSGGDSRDRRASLVDDGLRGGSGGGEFKYTKMRSVAVEPSRVAVATCPVTGALSLHSRS